MSQTTTNTTPKHLERHSSFFLEPIQVWRGAQKSFEWRSFDLQHILSTITLLLFLLLVSAKPTRCVELSPEGRPTGRSVTANSQQGVIIDSIIVVAGNVFNPTQTARWWIYGFLNSAHTTTREKVIWNELTLQVGDRYDTTLAYESERLLRSLPFIFDAEVWVEPAVSERDSPSETDSIGSDTSEVIPKKSVMYVHTIDKWSLSGGFQMSRRSGRTAYSVGVKESNFLGLGHLLKATYDIPEGEPNYASFEYSNPRLLGLPAAVSLKHNSNPLDRRSSALGAFGLVRRSERFGARIFAESFRSRRLSFLGSESLGTSQAQTHIEEGKRMSLSGTLRSGGEQTKVSFTTSYSYQEQEFQVGGTTADYPLIRPEASLPEDSVIHRLSQTIELRSSRFMRRRGINFLGRVEDISIEKGVSISVTQARGRGLVAPLFYEFRAGVILDYDPGDVIFETGFSRTSRISSGEEISSENSAALRSYYSGIPQLTLASRIGYRHQRNSDLFDPLVLDEGSGVRGYPLNFRTGDRLVTGGLEMRTRSLVDILSTSIGLALFTDYGAIWRKGMTFSSAEKLWSVGFGLRMDLAQGGGGRIMRLDFAFAESLNAWQFSSGVRQYFDDISP